MYFDVDWMTLFDKSRRMESKTYIGVNMNKTLKQRLLRIAKSEHRSLSSQVEFFLSQSVEQWLTNKPACQIDAEELAGRAEG